MQKQIHFTEFAEFAGAEFASAFFLVFLSSLCYHEQKHYISSMFYS